jgi:GTPase
LKNRWLTATEGHCVFVSAAHAENVEELRHTMLTMIRNIYQERYPYRTTLY